MPEDEAIASLSEISMDPEALAHAAGILAGTARRGTDYERRIAAARLLVVAGANRERLQYWIDVGRYNATRPTGPGGKPDWPDDLDRVVADVVDGLGA